MNSKLSYAAIEFVPMYSATELTNEESRASSAFISLDSFELRCIGHATLLCGANDHSGCLWNACVCIQYLRVTYMP